MKAIVQRVSGAKLEVGDQLVSEIGIGLVVLVGIEVWDSGGVREWMADKLVNLRIFPDEESKMNRSLLDVGGQMMLVPNFTVAGDTTKGRRPTFFNAKKSNDAQFTYDKLVQNVSKFGVDVQTGVFGAHMHVTIQNDGPVTLIVDSQLHFG